MFAPRRFWASWRRSAKLLPQPGCFEGFSGIEVGANPSRFAVLELHHGTERRPGLDSAPLATCADAADSDNSGANLLDLRDLDLKLGKTIVKVSIPSGRPTCPRYTVASPPSATGAAGRHSTPASTSSSIALTSRLLNPSIKRLKASTFSCDIVCGIALWPAGRSVSPSFHCGAAAVATPPRCPFRVESETARCWNSREAAGRHDHARHTACSAGSRSDRLDPNEVWQLAQLALNDYGKQVPFSGDSLKRVTAPGLELDAGADHQVLDRA